MKALFPCALPSGQISLVVGSVADAAGWQQLLARDCAPDCDLLEVRADGLADMLTGQEQFSTPVLLTVRAQEEGGLRAYAAGERMALAQKLLPMAAALDWEIAFMEEASDLLASAKASGVTLIASAHDFDKTPKLAYLREQEQRARALGADVVKFAFRLNCYEDMQVGVELLRGASGPMAVMGMGSLGPVSRLLYAQHGSVLTYGYLGDAPTAPGQWSAAHFRGALTRVVSVSGK